MLETPLYPAVLTHVATVFYGYGVGSEKPSGADNQQGSPPHLPNGGGVTPQRLNAELLAVGAKEMEAYLQGVLETVRQSFVA